MIKLLARKNVRKILDILEQEKELYFREISKNTGINTGNLSEDLNKLYYKGLVSKRSEDIEKNLPKVYYSITDLGKDALSIYQDVDLLEQKCVGCGQLGLTDDSNDTFDGVINSRR
ncbi:winged helix-turn-helix domain-containing protein [Methanococcus voltae]|uniref:DNA-binding HxlR family transcriptional regulator n=2 Tax=Methanococcus voltae TaxID=2188 RepID=A0A8J7RF53_METVO|nr:winged helix-turn-helix domain-containing protein [Methanococcus voltae]MBP2171926.1 DNA-binding HxlR family transcriptional regulator [Methanococcus voltae]MBP2201119.1 DNA-binding HxlR family transcriptional regulator [Methanococcus voltae]MCS3921842.1 DNA-binding HxlR family transcriptional regulator [Methanococcus voltae PS]